jgi:hypothetical protein
MLRRSPGSDKSLHELNAGLEDDKQKLQPVHPTSPYPKRRSAHHDQENGFPVSHSASSEYSDEENIHVHSEYGHNDHDNKKLKNVTMLKAMCQYMNSTRLMVLIVLCLQNSLFTVLRRYSQGVLQEVYSKVRKKRHKCMLCVSFFFASL